MTADGGLTLVPIGVLRGIGRRGEPNRERLLLTVLGARVRENRLARRARLLPYPPTVTPTVRGGDYWDWTHTVEPPRKPVKVQAHFPAF